MVSENAKHVSPIKYSQCLDRYIIEYCAPTLAGMKTGGMFRIKFSSESKMNAEIQNMKNILKPKKVSLTILKSTGTNALIYVFREDKLKNDLKNPDLDNLLDELGYSKGGINTVLRQLKERMTENGDFPHEIGAFLGYPPKDVIGFVKNKGSNCLCSGWWKVYHDAENAKKMFLKFDKCRELYKKLYMSGKTALQLAVAA
ncbi:MAG: DUF3793 family protein [Lachnospiraceae bacterium]|nr:DUF3793 family protein [Lachnospiraceae bacterium]